MASKRSKAPPKRRKPAPATDEQPKPRPKLLVEKPAPKPTVRPAPPTRRVRPAPANKPAAKPATKPAAKSEQETASEAAPVSSFHCVEVSLGLETPKADVKVKAAGQTIPRAQCLVVCPSLSPIDHRTEEKLRELENRGYTVIRAKGFSAVEQGRNQMASEAIHRGFRETMWIEPDVDFECDSVDRLRSHGLPIVCGIYPQKGRRALSCDVLPGTEKIVFGEEGGLTEVQYASCGFMLVQTAAYLRIRDRLSLPLCNTRGGQPGIWPFFQDLVKPVLGVEVRGQESGVGSQESEDTLARSASEGAEVDSSSARSASEGSVVGGQKSEVGEEIASARYHPRNIKGYFLSHDFAFCERARQVGLKIMADTTIRLWHLGTYGYSWEEAGHDVERFDTYEYYVE